MSSQAYPDAIEDETGRTPRALVHEATAKGVAEPGVTAGTIVAWLAEDDGLGRGHAMALVHVITKGPTTVSKHVGSTGTRRDESDTFWLDGKATRPTP